MRDYQEVIEQMKSIPWLAHVGEGDLPTCTLSLMQVRSWTEAIERRGCVSTANAFDEGRGMLTRELGIQFRSSYRKWNETVDCVNSVLEEYVLGSVNAVVDLSQDITLLHYGTILTKQFVRWDLVHYIMEYVYSDLVSPRFYTAIFAIYQAGHFPCGWDEKWPDGTLWLY